METFTSVPFDQRIDSMMQPVASIASEFIFYSVNLFGSDIPLIVLWLIGGGLFFTFYLRFINFRGFKHAIDILGGKFADPNDPEIGRASCRERV